MKCWTRGKKDGSKYVTCDTKANAKSKPKAKAKKQVERVMKKAKAQVTRAKPKAKVKPKSKAKSYADRVDDVVRAAEGVANRQTKGPKMFKMRNRIRGDK